MENNLTFEQVLERDRHLAYTNVGVSMLPLIREGRDVMIIEKCATPDLKKFDAVFFCREGVEGRGRYVLHRILKIMPNGDFFIAGDNCCEGEVIKPYQILGVLSGINRGGKPYNLGGFGYKTYVALWCAPYNLRFVILRIKRFFKRYLRAIFYRLKIRR